MKKKLVVVLMAAVMAMTAVTGCGSKADDAKNDTQASKASESETSANADQEAAMHVADLIDAIYVQERTDDTDKQCKEAKEAWDKLTDAQKELVEGENADPDYFGRDTGDASKDDPRNQDDIGENEILVVSFGTSFNDSRVADIKGVEDAIAAANPDWSVRRAFTAQIIINHVQARDDEKIDNMDQALERAVKNGVKNLVVQPTHLMHGAEYDELSEAVEKYKDKFESVKIAEPLLGEVGSDATVVNEDKKAVAEMKDGDVVLLQNTRFRKEETKNLEPFSSELASLADVFVMDAFGSAHRAHCSTVGVTDHIKDTAVGYLMQKEIDYLGNAVETPVRPFVAILGGAKVADKLNVISNLLEKCDTLIIGGGMAYTFLKAQGKEVGLSLVDDTKIDYCKEMMAKAEKLGKKLLLPIDTTIAAGFPDPIDAEIEVKVVDSDKIPADMEGLDIGTKTQELFADAVKSAKTVVWNGPMGVFENPTLAKGTIAVAKALADTDATTIIGGGDSAAAVIQLGFADKMSHISTGGGASLEYLEGKVLPGIAAVKGEAYK